MQYGDTEKAIRLLETIPTLIDKALQAESTRDIFTFAGQAQAAVVELKEYLRDGVDADSFGDADPDALSVAAGDLGDAAVLAEKVGLGTDAESMRGRVEDFKSALDPALSEVSRALGLPPAG